MTLNAGILEASSRLFSHRCPLSFTTPSAPAAAGALRRLGRCIATFFITRFSYILHVFSYKKQADQALGGVLEARLYRARGGISSISLVEGKNDVVSKDVTELNPSQKHNRISKNIKRCCATSPGPGPGLYPSCSWGIEFARFSGVSRRS